MNVPDFENYSLDELLDSLNNIDKNKYPERVEKIELELKKREGNQNILLASDRDSMSDNPFKHKHKKRKSFWDRHKIDDINSAERAIKKGWVAGLFFSAYLSILTMLAVTGNIFILNNGYSIESFIDVILILVISYGVFRKSRTCAVLLTAYVYLPHLIALLQSEKSNFSLIETALLYFFGMAVIGTIKYHKFSHKELEIKQLEASDDLNFR